MIDELKRFILAANEGNITKTAEKIFITQSALTQSIQRLEKTLGTKLFIQKGKYLHLTEDGRAVVIIGNKILQLWENAKDTDTRRINKPTIGIGMFDNAALRLGSFVQSTFTSDFYRLELTIEGSGKLFNKLKLGVIDVSICVLSRKDTLPTNVSLIETFTEELIPVSSKKFSGQIKTIPFILYNKDSYTREQTDAVFAEKNIQPIVFVESTSTTFMKELAMLGSGVALLPKNFVRSEISQGSLIKQRLPMKWHREYGIYINKQNGIHKNHPLIKDLSKALKKAL